MRKPPIRRGTPSEIAKHEAGYSASGESVFTREAANASKFKLNASFTNKHRGKLDKPRERLIDEVRSQISFLICELRIVESKAKRAKLEATLEAKRAILLRVMNEMETKP